MEYSHEPLTITLIDEFETLLHKQYQTTVANTDIPPYDFAWDMYLQLQMHGMLYVFVARDETAFVGMAMYIVTQVPHHKSIVAAECDSINVYPEYRGKSVGRHLYQLAETAFNAMGIQMIIHRYRECYDTEPMFEKLGFKQIERVYMKEL